MADPLVRVDAKHPCWTSANDDDWGSATFDNWCRTCAAGAEVHLEIPDDVDATTLGIVVRAIASVARRLVVVGISGS